MTTATTRPARTRPKGRRTRRRDADHRREGREEGPSNAATDRRRHTARGDVPRSSSATSSAARSVRRDRCPTWTSSFPDSSPPRSSSQAWALRSRSPRICTTASSTAYGACPHHRSLSSAAGFSATWHSPPGAWRSPAGSGSRLGFASTTGSDRHLLAFALCIVFGFALSWMFVALGFVAGSPQAAQSTAFLVFPFTFVSSAFVPVSTMPSWMQGFAAHQPVTEMVNSVRILTEGHAAQAVLGHSVGCVPPLGDGVGARDRAALRSLRRRPASEGLSERV